MFNRSTALSGNTAIATYNRDGVHIPAMGIEEFVTLQSRGFPCEFVNTESDLRLLCFSTNDISSQYRIEIYTPEGYQSVVHSYQGCLFEPGFLILPKGYKLSIYEIMNLASIQITAKECSIVKKIVFGSL